ncbi:MAG TPA: hypothetical protein VK689_13405, partial [Armatimonadota bacterium]|nr:hypothetical protein [Armatimonadota bacterium]
RTSAWEIQALTWEEGTVSVEGGTLILRPVSGKYKVMDNQVARNNYERPMRDEELEKNRKTSQWRLEKDPRTGKPALMMGNDKGSFVRFTLQERD